MEETKAKTSIAEDWRKKEKEEGGKGECTRDSEGEWMGMSAGLAIQKDKADGKGGEDYESGG